MRVRWTAAHESIVEGRLREPGRIYDDFAPAVAAEMVERGLAEPADDAGVPEVTEPAAAVEDADDAPEPAAPETED